MNADQRAGGVAPQSTPPHGLHILEDMLTNGDPRDLTHQQIPYVRAVFESADHGGLWLFARFVCGMDKLTSTLHREMCEFLSQWGQPGWRRLLMMVPRGSYKTSIGSKALPLWLATKDSEVTIGIFNAAEKQAKDWIGNIRQVVERSTLYHQLWPERLPPGVHYTDREAGRTVPRSWRWGDSGLDLVRRSLAVSERTFEPYGIGGSSTGRHYTHRIMDDLIGEVSAQSPTMIEDAIHFVSHARALERPPNGGCELVNCTPWAYRDCYSFMLETWPNDYQVYRRALLENPTTGEPDIVNGESIFPQSIDTAAAKEMYERDSHVFMSQYQCSPRAGRETSFQAEWIRPISIHLNPSGEKCIRIPPKYFDPSRVHGHVHTEQAPDLIPLSWCDKAILVDPAPSKKIEKNAEPRARNGLVALAMDPWGRIFTLQSVPLREDPVTVMEAVVMMAVYWKLYKVGIESVNFSAIYGPMWSALIRHRHPALDLSFIPLEPKGEDKDTRIRRLVAPHREGLWYVNTDLCGYFTQELLEFPHCETRDLIDAAAYWHKVLSRPQTPTELELDSQSQWEQSSERGLCGY